MKRNPPFSPPKQPWSNNSVDLDQELEEAVQKREYPHILHLLDQAPRAIRNQPKYQLLHAIAVAQMGDEKESFRLMREIQHKNPNYLPVYFPLALHYMDHEWPAHALHAAKRALAERILPKENRAMAEKIIEDATDQIQREAAAHGLPFEIMLCAVNFNEKAQIAFKENSLQEAEYFARESIKLAPNWHVPMNNRALALYYSGRCKEALAISAAVLELDPENIFALSSLVTYHLGLSQTEQAQAYANRLEEQSQTFPRNGLDIERIITALAAVENTPALSKIAKGYLTAPPDSLSDRSWHCLAVAAVRSGNWKDALKLIRKPAQEDLYPAAKRLRQDLESVARKAHPQLAWMPPVYPGIDLLLHEHVMKEWEALLNKVSDPPSPSQKRNLGSFIQRYPFFLVAMKRLLYQQETCPSALETLVKIDMPEADAEILKFALSQVGAREARVQALLTLMQTGRYTGSKTARIWFEDQEEWRELEVNTQRIGETEPNARPKTLALIEKARLVKDPQVGIALLRKAAEIEPTSPIALFNLGVVLVKNGQVEEGNALIQKSIIVDPNYSFGHASIALSESDKGNDHEAIYHLEIISRAEVIAPQTALIANLAWVQVSLNKLDLKAAREHYELAAKIMPGNPLLEEYEEMLKDAEEYAENNAFIIDFQRQSAQRSHQKLLKTPLANDMNLHQCLEANSKEMLVGTAHYLQISSSGKKSQLVSRLAETLLDEDFLYITLPRDLAAHEREALKWLLEAGGVHPWKDFIRRYGDDLHESVLWDYHEPKSIPGRLRMCALLFSGTLDDQQVAFLPADLRPLLQKTLVPARD